MSETCPFIIWLEEDYAAAEKRLAEVCHKLDVEIPKILDDHRTSGKDPMHVLWVCDLYAEWHAKWDVAFVEKNRKQDVLHAVRQRLGVSHPISR